MPSLWQNAEDICSHDYLYAAHLRRRLMWSLCSPFTSRVHVGVGEARRIQVYAALKRRPWAAMRLDDCAYPHSSTKGNHQKALHPMSQHCMENTRAWHYLPFQTPIARLEQASQATLWIPARVCSYNDPHASSLTSASDPTFICLLELE